MKIGGLIVAAGLSSRMKNFKPLMKIDNKPLILHTIDSLRRSGIKDICVVLGFRGEEIEEALKDEGITMVYNHRFRETSMYDSFKIGLEKIKDSCDAIAFTPADIGFVTKYTVDLLVEEINRGEKNIVYSRFEGIKGHPTIISKKCFDYLLNYSGEGGLKLALTNMDDDSIIIDTPDKFVLLDTDTPDDFERVKNYYENRNYITEGGCMNLLRYSNVPENVINHSKKVKEVACDLVNAINQVLGRSKIDVNLISSSALLHDIKRSEKQHALEGAKFLNDLGYDKIAQIVKTHMTLDEEYENVLNENSILYLADKLIYEDKFVGVKNRFKNKIDKYKDDASVYENVMKRYNAAVKIEARVEILIGKDAYENLKIKWRDSL